MQGRIIKGVGGFYDVQTEECGVYACRAVGIFRKEKVKPLVGDMVEITILDEKDREGSLTAILPRKNELIRPEVANVDQALVIFAVREPQPNYALLDRFLIAMEQQHVEIRICFNKEDLGTEEELTFLYRTYTSCGYPVLLCSAAQSEGIEQIREVLAGRTTVVAGPSGVGKSSLTNLLQSGVSMETGVISRKLGRGKHTTRHSQLIPIGGGAYLVDTPGFSAVSVSGLDKEELKQFFPEFAPYEEACRFQGCMHIHEPGCAVKQALEEKKISALRYGNYVAFYEELKEREKRRYQ